MPTTLPARRPPRRDFGAVICLVLACAPAALVAATGGRPSVDPENSAHLDTLAVPGASRLAVRACPEGEAKVTVVDGMVRVSGPDACGAPHGRLAVRTAGRH